MQPLTLADLLDLEHAGWRALCESRGGSFYGELMLPDALFILVDGSLMSRDDVVSSLDGAPGWEHVAISHARALPLGPETTALIYRAEATRADLEQPFIASMSSVYRRLDGRIRLALYQQTTVTH